MKKRKLTSLFAGILLPAMVLTAQVPVNVVGDMKVATGGNVKSQGQVTVNANAATNGVIINNGTLSVPEGITFVSNQDRDGMLLNNGTVNLPTDASKVKLKVTGLSLYDPQNENASWHFISFPFEIDEAAVLAANPNTDGVYFDKYDGQKRANTNLASGNWTPAEGILAPHIGYSFAMGMESTVSEVVFPASNITNMYSDTKSTTITLFTSPKKEEGWGWNCVGSPYTANYLVTPSNLGISSGFIYYYDTANDMYQSAIVNTFFPDAMYKNIPPFKFFFVKMDQDTETSLVYKKTGANLLTDNNYLRSAPVTSSFGLFSIKVSGEDSTIPADNVQVFVSDAEQCRETYYGKTDAPKLFSKNPVVTEIWMPVKGSDLSIAGYPHTENREILLNLKTGVTGSVYTIEIDEAFSLNTAQFYQSVSIVDKELNIEHDLSQAGAYSFLSDQLSYEDRFVLRLGNESTTNSSTTVDGVVIYASNNTLYIQNIAENDVVNVYDLSGRLVKKEISNANNIEFSIEKGTYIVKVSGEKNATKKVTVL